MVKVASTGCTRQGKLLSLSLHTGGAGLEVKSNRRPTTDKHQTRGRYMRQHRRGCERVSIPQRTAQRNCHSFVSFFHAHMHAQRLTAASGRLRHSHHRAFTTQRPSRRGALLVRNMFTGIVQGMATVDVVQRSENFSSLGIRFPDGKVEGIQIGASVAINGTCLTVTKINGDNLNFDVMVETLRATNLGTLEAGSRVNFERSARVGDEIGGHNVSGHVHTTATVVDIQDTANNRKITFEFPDDKWMKYVLPKGYIAVNGCSLTIGEVVGRTFNVYLIPETLRVTVFGAIEKGTRVNVEIETQTQAIVDTTERVVAAYLERTGLKVTVPAS